MKIAIHFNDKDKWETIAKVRNISITETFIILTMMNDEVKVIDRDKVKYIRETKLYER